MSANKPTRITNMLAFTVLVLLSVACALTESTDKLAIYALNVANTATAPTTVTTAPSSTQATCQVSTDVNQGLLNLRSGPGLQYSVVTILNEGETLDALTSGHWMKVTTRSGVTGWINGAYCN
jgi:uncharacterized protein YgiM (DUF1202 family)